MDWELENENLRQQDMIIVYEQEIKKLEIENEVLLEEVRFLKLQLDYKTHGLPSVELEED
tara:strand:- start:309 stop:488 length:180 start_codon:yes stop_codon:yes gene_type:complete